MSSHKNVKDVVMLDMHFTGGVAMFSDLVEAHPDISRQSLYEAVRLLKAAGFMRSSRNPENRKMIRLEFTKDGRRAASKISRGIIGEVQMKGEFLSYKKRGCVKEGKKIGLLYTSSSFTRPLLTECSDTCGKLSFTRDCGRVKETDSEKVCTSAPEASLSTCQGDDFFCPRLARVKSSISSLSKVTKVIKRNARQTFSGGSPFSTVVKIPPPEKDDALSEASSDYPAEEFLEKRISAAIEENSAPAVPAVKPVRSKWEPPESASTREFVVSSEEGEAEPKEVKKPNEKKPSSREVLYGRIRHLAEKNMFARYWDVPPLQRDILFADCYYELYRKHFGIYPQGAVGAVCHNFLSARKNFKGICRDITLARERADSQNALYEDYLGAIFEWYAEDKPNPKYEFPVPRLIRSDKAAEVYTIKFIKNRSKTLRYTRDELFPQYFPENYTGTPKQIRYFSAMMEDIIRVAEAQRRSFEEILTAKISERLVPVAFAEDDNLNAYSKRGYKYATYSRRMVEAGFSSVLARKG